MSECRSCRVEIDSANMSFGTDEVCAGCDNYVTGAQMGRADGVQSAIDLLKKLRPEHSGLGIIIHALKELVENNSPVDKGE